MRPAPETWNGQAWSKVAFTRGNTGMLTGDGITSIPQGGPYVAGLSQIPGTRDILAATASTYDTAMTILKYTPLRTRLQ